MPRPNSTARGYGHPWRRTRGRYLKHHPTCEHEHCDQPAIEVHHLDGLGPKGPRGHKWDNLQALCKSHHSSITAHEQPGGWHATPPRKRPAEQHPGLLPQDGGGPPLGKARHRGS